jgi:predicted nucleic acid-binding protein
VTPMTNGITHMFWDSCVFCALLYDQHQIYDLNSIQQYLREATEGKHRIYTSSLVFAEVVPSQIKKTGVGTFQQFIDDFQGAILVIDPSPNVMHRAGVLRDLPYKKQNAPKRRLATTDAIMLASCLYLVEALNVAVDFFHTYDDGKKKGGEGKMVPLLSYQDWCEGFTSDQMKIAQPVINLKREKPIHPSPGLPYGSPQNANP